MKKKELMEKVESFLLDYANGLYGKNGDRFKITKEVVDDFMEKSNIEDLEEVRMHFQFIDDMLSDMLGNIDLEDYVNYVVNLREENERF